MSDIFISHVEEDADVALEIALGLEEAGYSTWCYEVDNIPGPSYLLQTGQRIEQAKAVVVVISPHSIGSHQVTREVVRAHESGKHFIPVRRDISHIEFQNRQPEWREAIGAASSISVTKDDVEVVTRRIMDGLEALGIHPKPKAATDRIEQIRGILTKLQESGVLEGVAKPTVSPKKSEAESAAAEVPYVKTAEKPGRRRSLIKKSSITAAAIAVITLAVILLSGGLAKYTLSTAYTLTISISPAGKGHVSPSGGSYESGEEVTVTASAASGYTGFTFDHWSGDVSGTAPTITITMDSDKSLTAHFVPTERSDSLSDDFSDPSSGWDTQDDSYAQISYRDGCLYIKDYTDVYFNTSLSHHYFTDFILEVETWLVDGSDDNSHMVLCRHSENNFYAFSIGADGGYRVWKDVDDNTVWAVDRAYSAYIHQGVGAVNLIHIECIGDNLSLSVNEHLLWEGTDSDFTGGDIALGASVDIGAGTFTEVAFDNIEVYSPD